MNVDAKEPDKRAPCKAPAAPASDSISNTLGLSLNILSKLVLVKASIFDAIGLDGVIGYILHTSLK